jgi:site-specific DNA-methyltransferase (adenine-specific)
MISEKRGYMPKSKTDDWATPRDFYNKLDNEFHFDFDPCPLNSTFDGLSNATEWGKCNFINPPHKKVYEFVRRAYYELKNKGKMSVLLLPVRTDTKWFHEFIYGQFEIRFIKGRLKFGDGKNSATFPSMVVIMREELK